MNARISSAARATLRLLLPEGLILLGAVILQGWVLPHATLANAAPFFAGSTLAGGTLLAWRFHRSRVVLSLVVLGAAIVTLHRLVWSAPPTVQRAVVFDTVALLIPANLIAISLLGERGIFTTSGALRTLIAVLQAALVAVLAYPYPSPAAVWLEASVLPEPLQGWTALPDPAVLAFVAATIWAILRLVWRPSSEARALLWGLVALCLALQSGTPADATVYIGTAALILAVSVIEATYFMAFRDSLTELPGRRALSGALPRLGQTYSIAMVDVDRFKKFNDQHGHDVGDQVLRMVAKHLGRVTGGGKAYRYGGEEFAILFPGKTRDECTPHLESVREAIERTEFTLRGRSRPRMRPSQPTGRKRRRNRISVTVSVGVAERNGRHTTPERVVQAADQALYRAKKAGRNRISR